MCAPHTRHVTGAARLEACMPASVSTASMTRRSSVDVLARRPARDDEAVEAAGDPARGELQPVARSHMRIASVVGLGQEHEHLVVAERQAVGGEVGLDRGDQIGVGLDEGAPGRHLRRTSAMSVSAIPGRLSTRNCCDTQAQSAAVDVRTGRRSAPSVVVRCRAPRRHTAGPSTALPGSTRCRGGRRTRRRRRERTGLLRENGGRCGGWPWAIRCVTMLPVVDGRPPPASNVVRATARGRRRWPGSAATTRCRPLGAYSGSDVRHHRGVQHRPAIAVEHHQLARVDRRLVDAKHTAPTGFESTGGRSSSRRAAGPSRRRPRRGPDLVPSAVSTAVGPDDAARVHRAGSIRSGSRPASCSGIACMPAAGTTESPSASIRKITSNMRRTWRGRIELDAAEQRSEEALDDRRSEKPASRSARRVRCRRGPGAARPDGPLRSRCRSSAMRALSTSEPTGLPERVERCVDGARNGSAITDARPSRYTSAPGSKARRSSASRSSWRCASG